MKHGESEQARVAAANALLDRGYGKPEQSVDQTVRDAGYTKPRRYSGPILYGLRQRHGCR